MILILSLSLLHGFYTSIIFLYDTRIRCCPITVFELTVLNCYYVKILNNIKNSLIYIQNCLATHALSNPNRRRAMRRSSRRHKNKHKVLFYYSMFLIASSYKKTSTS